MFILVVLYTAPLSIKWSGAKNNICRRLCCKKCDYAANC